MYLLAFDSRLRGAYDERELMALADTMAERGIRLRRSLTEVMEEFGGDGKDARRRADEGMTEENELEYESRERRRLMPY